MSQTNEEREKQILALFDAPSQPSPPCDKAILYKVLTVLFIVLIVGGTGSFLLAYYKWTTENDQISDTHRKTAEANKGIIVTQQHAEELKKEYDGLVVELNKIEVDIKNVTNINNDIEKKIQELKKEIDELNRKIAAVQKEKDAAIKETGKLKNETVRLDAEIKKVTAALEEVKHYLKLNITKIGEYKAATAAGLVVSILGLVDELSTYSKMWHLEYELKKQTQFKDAMRPLSYAYESYQFLQHTSHAPIARKACFHGFIKKDLEKCVGLPPPLIITITTTTGFRFGVVLSINWQIHNGSYNDAKAYAFSDNHADIALINDAAHALVVNTSALLQFGTRDIVLSQDGRTGHAYGASYAIPNKYEKDKFFHNGEHFEVEDIMIEEVNLT